MIDPTFDAITTESQRTVESPLADYESELRDAKRLENPFKSTIGSVKEIALTRWFAVGPDLFLSEVGSLKDGFAFGTWEAMQCRIH